jgi:NADH-quinone oxidoreductase subunit A
MGNAPELWLLAVYSCGILALVAAMIGGSYILGQRHVTRATIQPFESGILPTTDARLQFPIQFYFVAVLFVVFDLESVFIYAWAVALRPAGWNGYLAMLSFIVILLVALAYLWRIGALDWGPRRRLRPAGSLR